jgi:hypothetical protein
VNAPGYTVLAIATDGTTTSVRARTGGFRLTPPAGSVTLHLRAPNGVYAGPIVIRSAQRGRRAILGVKAGARLGRVDLKSRRGFASVRRPPPKMWVDRQLWARVTKGAPLGVGRFGRVRSRPSRVSVAGDTDLDGIPDLIDIDDDGDLILDKFDRASAGQKSLARESAIDDEFLFESNLTLNVEHTANANAVALTQRDIDAALSQQGVLQMGILPGDSPELDCGQPQSRTDPGVGGLVYCSRGGTGRYQPPPTPGGAELPPFPDAFDADGDGFGLMTPSSSAPAPGSGQMALRHGATTAQIGTGDLLIQRVTRGGTETQFPGTVQYVFATVPALVSYSDGQGNSATVNYPVAAPVHVPPTRPGGPGTRGNGFPVTAPPGANVSVTLTFWRPQRRPIPPETGEWTDIGGLNHTALEGDSGGAGCPRSAFSTSDPNLRPLTTEDVFPNSYSGLKDLAPDRPASPANTFTYTLDLTACLAARGLSFTPGEERMFAFPAQTPNGPDSALQAIAFRRH